MDALLQQHHLITTVSPLLSEMAYTTDPNNNNNDDFDTTTTTTTKEDKYSLRPRSVRRVTETLAKHNKNNNETKSAVKSIKVTKTSTTTPKSHKPKQKPAPLSKYRRKTANARERNRMREINQAFETLRRVIPQMATTPTPATHSPSSTNEKLTKITTLRLAMKYISSLSASLNDATSTSTLESIFMEHSFSDCSDLDCLLLESDGESLPLSDDHSSLLASPDFPEPSLSPVDFGDPNSLSPFLQTDYHHSDFGDFLLT